MHGHAGDVAHRACDGCCACMAFFQLPAAGVAGLNSLKGGLYKGTVEGSIIGVKGDTRWSLQEILLHAV